MEKESEKLRNKFREHIKLSGKEKSLEEKLKSVMEQKIAGTAFWKLGLERASAWDVITKYVQ